MARPSPPLTPPDKPPRNPPRYPLAGGVLIAIGSILGTGVGLFLPLGPTRGFLIGVALGVLISLAMWLNDLRK